MVSGLRTLVGKQGVKGLMNVRKTQDGRLLLTCKKGEPEVEELRTRIKTSWKDVLIRCRHRWGGRGDSRCAFHLKDLDAAVDDEEVWGAIHEALPALQRTDLEIGEKQPMFGGNLAVTIRLDYRWAEQLRHRKKLRIGLNLCRLDERIEGIKCYKCWDFGHTASRCNGPDRRKLYVQCGKEGHVAASCENAPACVLCEVEGHRAGSGSCPRFREALTRERAAINKLPPPAPEEADGGRQAAPFPQEDTSPAQG